MTNQANDLMVHHVLVYPSFHHRNKPLREANMPYFIFLVAGHVYCISSLTYIVGHAVSPLLQRVQIKTERINSGYDAAVKHCFEKFLSKVLASHRTALYK